MREEGRPVLIVDDNDATRYAISRALSRHGYAVVEAATGQQGLDRLAELDPAALILDVNLPDMSGFDIVRKLRAEAGTQWLPVIHVSAAAIASGDMVTGLDAGADAYLIHPIDPDVLLATLRSLLRARHAEEAARRSEASFREIFENTGAPIAVVDSDLCIREANAAFSRLTGLETDACLDAVFHGQDDVMGRISQALRNRQRWHGQLALQVGDVHRDTEWRVAPHRESGMGLLFVQDITAHVDRDRARQRELDNTHEELAHEIEGRRHAEQQLAHAQKMDALGQLTGGIAHDFNNLLTSIIGGIDMAAVEAERGNLARIPRFLEIASSAAQRAGALTQRMLAFARKKPLDATPFDVNQRLLSLDDMLRRAIGENIQLELQLPDASHVVLADADTLDNVVINLVVNARDALSSGGVIHVRTALERRQGESDIADGEYVLISVTDNGSGIAPDVLEKVFEPFFTTKPVGRGTGLGLSMVYGFVRQSGGAVRIQSEVGRGTSVTLLLPSSASGPRSEILADDTPLGGASQKILLVDDSDLVRMMSREVLTDAGYQVVEAVDGNEALELLAQHPDIALLLTDIGLPGMNGRELAAAVRLQRPELGVLFVTGYADMTLEGKDQLDQHMDLLGKPYSLKDLLSRVQALLQATQARTPAA